MAFEGLTVESVILVLIFVGATAWMLHLLRQLNRTTKKSFHDLQHQMDRLEQQYVKIRPELDEMRTVLETKVDYDYLERKMHELVKIVMRRRAK